MNADEVARLRTHVDEHSVADIFERLAEEGVVRVPPKIRQLNLRVDAALMEALRRAAADRSTGSHTLARQLIVERLEALAPIERAVPGSRNLQLNLRLDSVSLSRLKDRAHLLGLPYHGLARGHLERSLMDMGYLSSASPATEEGLSVAWVTLLMLGADTKDPGSNAPIHNITRLEKLLFLADKTWSEGPLIPSFAANRLGPFTPRVYDAERRLSEQGLIQEIPGSEELRVQAEMSLDGIMAVVEGRGEESDAVKQYRVTEAGLDIVRRFVSDARWSTPEVRERLLEHLRAVRERFRGLSLDLLLAYVYLHYPEYTSRSEIKERVLKTIAAHPELADL